MLKWTSWLTVTQRRPELLLILDQDVKSLFPMFPEVQITFFLFCQETYPVLPPTPNILANNSSQHRSTEETLQQSVNGGEPPFTCTWEGATTHLISKVKVWPGLQPLYHTGWKSQLHRHLYSTYTQITLMCQFCHLIYSLHRPSELVIIFPL